MVSAFYDFFIWYYKDTVKTVLAVWKNYLWFNLNYFSLPILIKTFFSPWKKYHSFYKGPFEIWANLETLVFNLMSRIIGAIIRFFLLLSGLALEILILATGTGFFLIWICLPALIIFFFLAGIYFLK